MNDSTDEKVDGFRQFDSGIQNNTTYYRYHSFVGFVIGVTDVLDEGKSPYCDLPSDSLS